MVGDVPKETESDLENSHGAKEGRGSLRPVGVQGLVGGEVGERWVGGGRALQGPGAKHGVWCRGAAHLKSQGHVQPVRRAVGNGHGSVSGTEEMEALPALSSGMCWDLLESEHFGNNKHHPYRKDTELIE